MARNPYKAHRINPNKVALARHLRRNMTPTEKALWSALRRKRPNRLHFRRQVVIDGYIADFYCHAVGLIIEVDGGVHQEQCGYDGLRDQVMRAAGYRVLRVRTDEIERDLDGVLKRITEATEVPE